MNGLYLKILKIVILAAAYSNRWCLNCDEQISLGYKEIQPVHCKGDPSWAFIGRTDVEAETPILWPPVAKSWPIWKDTDAERDWGQEEKGTTEHEMVGLYHQLNGHGFVWTTVVGDGQGGLACCGSWCHKESDNTERIQFHFSLWCIGEGNGSPL